MTFPLSRPPDGYTVAGQITRSFDGGNFPIKGEVWRCKACGSLLIPSDQDTHKGFHATVGSALEAVSSLLDEHRVEDH